MEFVASVVRSLSWPTALIAVSVIFRKELQTLASRLSSARHKDTELLFGQKLDELRDQVEADAASIQRPADVSQGHPKERLPAPVNSEAYKGAEGEEATKEALRMAFQQGRLDARAAAAEVMGISAESLASTLADFPAAAILAAWAELEHVLLEVGDRLGMAEFSVNSVTNWLMLHDYLSKSEAAAIKSLRDMRNLVATHGVGPKSASAIEYGETVDRLIAKLVPHLI